MLDQAKFSTDVQSALYQLLQVVGECIGKRVVRDKDLSPLAKRITDSIASSGSAEEIPHRLWAIKSDLEKRARGSERD